MKIYSLLLLAFVSSISFFSSEAMACACCAERGAYSISTKSPTKFELDELKKLRFGAAKLYETAASPEDIIGISPLGEGFTTNALLDGKLWKFDIKDQTGNIGMLNLTKPVSMVAFAADIHDRDEGEVSLYKEWRFKYRVASASGMFRSGFAPATEYFLVLQGRGNMCTQAEDFTSWRLEITGKKAKYAFYGDLKTSK